MKTILITGITSELLAPFIEFILKEKDIKIIGTYHKTIPSFNDKRIELCKVDMSSKDEVDNFTLLLKEQQVDYLLHGHGDCLSRDHFDHIKTEDVYKDIQVNLVSTIRILQTIIIKMKENHFGRILLISTASASHGGGIATFAYGLSKSGIEYTVKALAKEYTKYNILTNAIAPGFFKTKFHLLRAGKTKQDFEERAKFVRLARAGEPDELVPVINTLLLENTFISGEIIKVDGADFI